MRKDILETSKQFIELLYTRLTISIPPPNTNIDAAQKPLSHLRNGHAWLSLRTFTHQRNPCIPLSLLYLHPLLKPGRRSPWPWLFKSFTRSLPQIKHKQGKEISNSPSKKHFPEARGIAGFLKMRASCSSCTSSGHGEEGAPKGWGARARCLTGRGAWRVPTAQLCGRPQLCLELSYTNLFFGSFCYYLRLFCKQTGNPSCKKYM